MFFFHAGDLVLTYEPKECDEYRGIVLEDQTTMNGYSVVKVLWKITSEYQDFFDEEKMDQQEVAGYSKCWERVETLGFISKLTTEELLVHDHPDVQTIGKQRARDEGSC
jgi:hypothetical protein